MIRVISYDPRYRDDMIYVTLSAKDALGCVPRLNEDLLDVPGRYILVDHALSRMERGLAGFLMVEGEPQPEIINGTLTEGSGH